MKETMAHHVKGSSPLRAYKSKSPPRQEATFRREQSPPKSILKNRSNSPLRSTSYPVRMADPSELDRLRMENTSLRSELARVQSEKTDL